MARVDQDELGVVEVTEHDTVGFDERLDAADERLFAIILVADQHGFPVDPFGHRDLASSQHAGFRR